MSFIASFSKDMKNHSRCTHVLMGKDLRPVELAEVTVGKTCETSLLEAARSTLRPVREKSMDFQNHDFPRRYGKCGLCSEIL